MAYHVRGILAFVGGALFVGGTLTTARLGLGIYPEGPDFPLAVAAASVGFGTLSAARIRRD